MKDPAMYQKAPGMNSGDGVSTVHPANFNEALNTLVMKSIGVPQNRRQLAGALKIPYRTAEVRIVARN